MLSLTSVMQETKQNMKNLKGKALGSIKKNSKKIINAHLAASQSSAAKDIDEVPPSSPESFVIPSRTLRSPTSAISNDSRSSSPLSPIAKDNAKQLHERAAKSYKVVNNLSRIFSPSPTSKDNREQFQELAAKSDEISLLTTYPPQSPTLNAEIKQLRELAAKSNKMIMQLQQQNQSLQASLAEQIKKRKRLETCNEEKELNKKSKQTYSRDDGEYYEERRSEKRKGFPEPVCFNSSIMARAEAVDAAYQKVEPSKFYVNMCYAVWGHKALAERCVKADKRNIAKKLLTPKKRRVIKSHFKHFLNHYKYPYSLYNIHMSQINTYAHRAITNAKAHIKLCENYPDGLDGFDDLSDHEELVEL